MESQLVKNDDLLLKSKELFEKLEMYRYVVNKNYASIVIPGANVFHNYESGFSQYCDMIKKSIDGDVISLTKRVFKDYDFNVDNEFFSNLTNDDIVETYALDSTRIYISPNFLNLNSYPVDALFKYEWFNLYDRDEFIGRRLQMIALDFLNGKLKGTVSLDIPPHIVKERFSEEKRIFKVKVKKATPVYDNTGDLRGLATVNEVWVLQN